MTPPMNVLYQYLVDRIDNPVCPTYSEMMVATGQKSKSGIARLLDSLERRGLITRTKDHYRSVRAVITNQLDGVPTATLIGELKRRGEWPHG